MIICNHLLLGGGKINNLKKVGKNFLSQLLCIATILGTTSCNDDQVFNQTDTAPLQVSVNAQGTQSSRAIIHGEYLPDGSSIGISLFNVSDGEDYDNQGYFNVKYTASGESESQSWAAQGTTPSISANPANLVAYYPWSDDENLDLTAIPVENQSQTDYMYSGLVESITNANPKVNITMQHALTAIRVNLVLGNYTGDAAVTGIAVKSPGLASAGTLNIASGALDNISGQGDEFALTTEFDLSVTGTTTDVLFVPDASVTEGSTTVSATIGGKKYTAAISFDEAYLQGYIYTYTLTLNNSGFEITKVSVNPWQTGNDDSAELTPDMWADALVGTFEIPENSSGEVTIDIFSGRMNSDLIKAIMVDNDLHDSFNDIDSRDGSYMKRTFTPGKHVVKYLFYDNTTVPAEMFKGGWDSSCYYYEDYLNYVKSREGGFKVFNFPYLTKIHIPDNFTTIQNQAFAGCHDLKQIEWSKNIQTIAGDAFYQCSGLEELAIPATAKLIAANEYENMLDLFGLLNLKKLSYDANNFTQNEISTRIAMTSLPYIELPNLNKVNIIEASNEKTRLIIVGSNTTDLIIDRDGNVIVGHLSYWDKIISKNLTAPNFKLYSSDEFMPYTGVLYVPTGATGYETWLEELPDGWTIQYIDDIESFTKQIKENIDEIIRQEELLKKEHSVDYANGIKIMSQSAGEYQIFSDDFDLSLVKKMFVTDMSTNTKAVIDVTSTLALEGNQLITVTLKDPTTVPYGMFKGVTLYLGMIFPECLESIDEYVFVDSNIIGIGFASNISPSITDNSLTGLLEVNPEGLALGVMVPENETDDYTNWEEFLSYFPLIWQQQSDFIPMSQLKLYFTY